MYIYIYTLPHSALGHGDKSDVREPRLVEALKGHKVIDVSAGRDSTLVLTASGDVFAFGADDYGQCNKNIDMNTIIYIYIYI